jgi:phosphohistidine swiveling domain-containing protein
MSGYGTTPPQSAHDAAIVGAPVRVAGRARTNSYSAVAQDDTADLMTTPNGTLIVRPFSIPEEMWNYAAAASGIVNTTTAVTIKAAVAGVRNYINWLSVQTGTLGGATELAIRDGAAGTVLWRTQLQTTALPLTFINFPTPLRGTANTLLEVVTLTAVTGGVYFNAGGYIATN